MEDLENDAAHDRVRGVGADPLRAAFHDQNASLVQEAMKVECRPAPQREGRRAAHPANEPLGRTVLPVLDATARDRFELNSYIVVGAGPDKFVKSGMMSLKGVLNVGCRDLVG